MSETINPVIEFNEIPATQQTPGNYVEIRAAFNSGGVLPIPARAIIFAQATAAGTGALGVVLPNVTPQSATALGGAGSQADLMAHDFFANNPLIPLDLVLVADAASSSAATTTLTIAGAWSVGWTAAVEIGGVRVQQGVSASDTPATLATNLAAAINAQVNPTLPVTATSALGVVTLTARNKGLCGNTIGVLVNPAPGDSTPAGVTVTPGGTLANGQGVLTGGATNPLISTLLPVIQGIWYSDIAMPWNDSVNVLALAAQLAANFDAMQHLDAQAWIGLSATFGAMLAQIAATNSQFIGALCEVNPRTPPWRGAAMLMGAYSLSKINDPARQLKGVVLAGYVPPVAANRLTQTLTEQLVEGGGVIYRVNSQGQAVLLRVPTTYLTNAQGVVDPTFHDAMTIAVASRVRWDWNTYLALTYPSNKLAPNGSLAAQADPTVMTPNRAKGSWAARSQFYEEQGWLVNTAANAALSIFTIMAGTSNRLNYSTPMNVIGNDMINAGVFMVQA